LMGPAPEQPAAPDGQAPAHAKEQERQARVMLIAFGSRGDVQPVVALAVQLKSRGFCVKMLVNNMHKDFVEAFSIEVCGYQAVLNFDVQGAMNGLAGADGPVADVAPEHRAVYAHACDFLPDLLLYTLRHFPVACAVEYQVGACTVEYCFHREGDMMTRIGFFNRGAKEQGRKLEHILGELQGKDLALQLDWLAFAMLQGMRRPVLYAVSPEVGLLDGSWPQPCNSRGVFLTGYWVVEHNLDEHAEALRSSFFGQDQMQALNVFLEECAPDGPVYIGWGSMHVVSRDFMAQKAVRALLRADRPGVVLDSYGPSSLDGPEDAAELKAYAAKRVFWLQSAPHEWLMPRCRSIVHHGGCGTTAASLRSGRPTVITPVAYDQHHWAQRVVSMGVGVSTTHLAQVTEQEIASALQKCEDVQVKERAAALGQKLREEHGAHATAERLDAYIKREVLPGREFTRIFRPSDPS